MFVSMAWSRHDSISALIVMIKLRRHLEFLHGKISLSLTQIQTL